MTQTTKGTNLKVGDTISVWWGDGRDTITSLRPYSGTLACLWQDFGGAMTADFALNKSGMTIEPQMFYEVH